MTCTHRRFRPQLPLVLSVLFFSSRTFAAGPLPSNGAPIETSSYQIDMYQGPVLSSSRSTGLAGSTAAIAEGVDGILVNAAAPAVRPPWSVDYFDYDLGFSFTSASALEGTDFDNNGRVPFHDGAVDPPKERFFFIALGGTLQWGPWAAGLSVDGQFYHLGKASTVEGAPNNLNVALTRGHVILARSFWNESLMIGAGIRTTALEVNATENVDGTGEELPLVEMIGSGVEVGAVFAPEGLPFRVGATFRSVVRGRSEEPGHAQTTPEGDTLLGGRYLPTEVVLPWELETGISYQFGPRPLNVDWINPRDEVKREIAKRPSAKGEAEHEEIQSEVRNRLKARAKALPRQKVLVSASALISGPVEDGVGVESFLLQRVERSGRWVTVQPRLGVEVEPLENRLQVRAGTYLEPSRFSKEIVRAHGTAGLDVRLIEWSVLGLFDDDTAWRVGAFVDGAQRYLSMGLTAGIWH